MRLGKPQLVLGAFVLGMIVASLLPSSWVFKSSSHANHTGQSDDQTSWACPMFCVVMDHKPADELCPVCGMELGPVSTGSHLVEHERAMVGLEAQRLEKIELVKELVLYGEVDWDETRLSVVSARSSGWIEKLSRKVTWEEVKKGDVLYELYAPELYEAQQELIGAKDDKELRDAAKKRLSLLGLADEEISAIEKSDAPVRTVKRRAKRPGVIVSRDATEGAHIKRGEEVFKLADISTIWVQLEVFEPDLHWLALDTSVQLREASEDGEAFKGRIVFADPVVDRVTRTARVRVEVKNRRRADGRWALLPGQRIEAKAQIAVTKNGKPVAADERNQAVLALPRDSVLKTGKRAVVYVLYDEANEDEPFRVDPKNLPSTVGYAMVEVVAGPLVQRAGDGPLEEFHPIIRVRPIKDPQAPKTLESGMVVATKGAFLIDSQAQLSGKPSLLFPNGRPTPQATGHEGH